MAHTSKVVKELSANRGVAAPQQFAHDKKAAGRLIYGGKVSRSAVVETGLPEIRDPSFSPENLYLANDIKTLNRWIRYYDTFHPILPNSLDIHAFFPISDFSFKGVKDPKILDFYTYVKEDVLKLLDWVILASREYEVLGEVFTFFGWDSYNGYYNSSTILNPDILDIYPFDMEGQRKFIISMDIPQNLDLLWRKKDMDSRYRTLWNRLDPVIRRCVETGYKIPLSPNNCFGIQRLAFAYDTRGTSQVLRCLKDLFHEDKLREAQMAVADGHITPMRLWKIGNTGAGYMPQPEELDEWRDMLQRAQHQNLFQIVCHDSVEYEVKGISEGLLDIKGEMEKIEERILTALYTSKAMTTGEGPTFSSSVIAMKVLEGRYQNKLYRIESIIKQLFRKIAMQHEFYEATPAEVNDHIYRGKSDRKLMVPKVHWENYFSFAKDIERAKFYLELAKAHKMSYKRVLEVLGLDIGEEGRLVENEINSVFSDDVLQARIKKVLQLTGGSAGTGDEGETGPRKGLPNNFAEPGGGGGGEGGASPLEEAGAEIPEGTKQPPLPNAEEQKEAL